TLVKPNRSIPSNVQYLTGISEDDVAQAPALASVLPSLRNFIGESVLVGHNIQFDVAFLKRAGMQLPNPTIDTYAIATVLQPSAASYSLLSLASLFGVASSDAHRALEDVMMTQSVYHAFWKQAFDLPIEVLREIVLMGRQFDWDARLFFDALSVARASELDQIERSDDASEAFLLGLFPREFATTQPEEDPAPLDYDLPTVTEALSADGPLASADENFELREEQSEMLGFVAEAFDAERHILIEAPPGTGKTLAYLLPAAWYARANRSQVVISTGTIVLQDQIINHDTAQLQRALPFSFDVALLKGREHYLCPRRLLALRRRGPTSSEEMQMFARIVVWLWGYRAAPLNTRGPAEMTVWRRLSANDERCALNRCADQMDRACPYYQARRRAEQASIVVINHALLLADLMADTPILPPFAHIIIDEAHHLEDASTRGLGYRVELEGIQRQLAALGNQTEGLLADLLGQTEALASAKAYRRFNEFAGLITEASAAMGHHTRKFFVALRRFLTQYADASRAEHTQYIRIDQVVRNHTNWREVNHQWERLSQFTSGIANGMSQVHKGLLRLSVADNANYGDLVAAVRAASRYLSELDSFFREFVASPMANAIYWVEVQPDGSHVSIHYAPLSVAGMLREYVWNGKKTAILTSATLRTDGTFTYIKDRLGLQGADEAVVSSPFDYRENALVYTVEDMPDPSERDAYQSGVERVLIKLCRATEGRTLVLFTSYAQLRQTASAITDSLADAGIVVYDQSMGSSRSQLLDEFVQADKAVLLGTRSFWEGIDVPGDDLSVLVVVRLPFSVPTDPIFSARGEQAQIAFLEIALPEALLMFRQGFGRLIRSKTDRGVFVILDHRVISKRYGQKFLDVLPPATLRRGPMAQLPEVAVQWLKRDRDTH
ncbi:MAG: DEAD/DEAH box helicase family protein, partial [Chloroflexi bacterium]|nr:DEAD/DEAH box helicase family protein [Chloroflexota bacterium]